MHRPYATRFCWTSGTFAHPVTGRKCVYVSVSFVIKVLGIDEEEGLKLRDYLIEHGTQPRYVYHPSPGLSMPRASCYTASEVRWRSYARNEEACGGKPYAKTRIKAEG